MYGMHLFSVYSNRFPRIWIFDCILILCQSLSTAVLEDVGHIVMNAQYPPSGVPYDLVIYIPMLTLDAQTNQSCVTI